MFRTFADMFKNKDIRNRIFFTLAMLFVFRFGSAITVPGVDVTELIKGMQDSSLFAMINMLGGGGLEQLSIFAMGVGPYITASIIIQLLSMDVIPALTELAKGGATGKKQIDRYTRYLAVVLSFFQASTLVYSFSTQYKTLLVNGSGWASILYVATLLTAGSMFILWIGDRISMKGIGNGVHDHCCRYHLQTAISVYNSMADTGGSKQQQCNLQWYSDIRTLYCVLSADYRIRRLHADSRT